jgi:hypothetical protein
VAFDGAPQARATHAIYNKASRRPIASLLACASDADFRELSQGECLMGANTVRTSARKRDGSVKVYQVYLTEEGKKFFTQTRISSPKYV